MLASIYMLDYVICLFVCISMLFFIMYVDVCVCSLHTDITVCLLCLVFKSGDDIEVCSNSVLHAKSRNSMSNNLKTVNYDCVLLVLELGLDWQVSTTLLRLLALVW